MLKQAKILLAVSVGAIVLAFGMFGVTLRNKVTQFAHRQQSPGSTIPAAQSKPMTTPPAPVQKMSPDTRAPQSEQHAAASAQDVSLPDPAGWMRMKNYVGKWNGTMIEPQGMSVFTLELRENPLVQGGFSGYSSTVALPMTGPAMIPGGGKSGGNPLAALFASMTPNSVLWTGEPDRKGIAFHVEKRVGKPKCAMTSLTVTPFGTTQLLAEWTNDGCPDGQVLLAKGER